MIYTYNNEYYIKMSRRLVKVDAKLDINGDVDFTPTKNVIDASTIDVSKYKEISLNDIKKELSKPSSIKEDIPKKVTKIRKTI